MPLPPRTLHFGAVKNVLEVLKATTEYFSRHGVESPRLNAEHLLAYALGKKRMELYLQFDYPLSETELAPLREKVKARAEGRPLQHLLGTVEFYGLTLRSDARALIPRPETEELIELLLKMGKPFARILDIGTGSGCIALSLASALPGAEVMATDLSQDALGLARENTDALELSERVKFFHGDLFADADGRFDLIVANLPYIPRAEVPTLQREVQHDPVSALDGGERGTEIIERLFDQAPSRLNPGGTLALEIGIGQAEFLVEFAENKQYGTVVQAPDLGGVVRFILATVD